MSDVARAAPEVETPVNPYSLLEAVNSSSETAHTGWLIFLAIMTYFMIAVAGVTHKALLLETPVALPIMQVNIPITQFFRFAPVVLVLFHIGVIAQLVMLARKTIEFDQAIRLLEDTDRRSHPLRLELDNFFFVQAVAGPQRSRIMSGFLHAMSWLTLVIIPVVLLLYIQIVFLPYHDVSVTWIHRAFLLLDIGMLVLIGVFLIRAEASFLQAFWRTTRAHPVSFLATTSVLLFVMFFSLFVATIPGERLDRLMQPIAGSRPASVSGRDVRQVASFAFPFLKADTDGSLFGFQKYLVVTDTDLVVDKDVTSGEPTLNLRGRDLRFARLDRSDLHQADLTGADLSDASFSGADLRNAIMHCSNLDDLILAENRETARCVTARRANFKKARLADAQMAGIDLRHAVLEEARLEGADLSYSALTGANFSSARLDKADITGGVQAQAANFLVASLQGADLTGAQLQFADFSSSSMQGALLSYAHLQGAILRDADLEGADLFQAKLHAADMTGAKTRAVDMRGAGIWMTLPPGQDTMALSELGDLSIKPIDELDVSKLAQAIDRVDNILQRNQVKTALSAIMNLQDSRKWAGTTEQLRWDSIAKAASTAVVEGYKAQLSEYLVRLACRARFNSGAVATGVARRAQTQQFRGDLLAISDKLKAADCPAGAAILPKVQKDLSAAADSARSN